MDVDLPCRLFPDPKQLLLDMAKVRTLEELLQMVVRRIAGSPSVCLARIWLVRPGGPCETCPMRAECPDQTQCLHLVASAGASRHDASKSYTHVDGKFRRFPLGVRKVGRIAQTGEALEAPNLADSPAWIADPEWVRAEGINGFGGQPLVCQGQVLGVLAIFSRAPLGAECLEWLRMVANHAAAAIANARAWDDVQALRGQLELERDYLREEVLDAVAFGDMIGQSDALKTVARQIELVAHTDSSVLILGETGTGKELVAREIHRRSRRAPRLMVTVNCAAVARDIFESEFFGHRKGAFTGAMRDRIGRFELADGGTLFLDEVGEIPLDLQGKLLRVLEEGELERVGEERTRQIDVRVIAATNRDLRKESDEGRFRSDLYFRLSVFPIEVAPLRRRKEDIPALAEHFLETIARKLGRPIPRLTLANVQRLQQHDWPGNVRELQHVLERALITSSSGRLTIDAPVTASATAEASPLVPGVASVLTAAELRRFEAENIRKALQLSNEKIYGSGGAAELLQMKPTTLSSRMRALGIRPATPHSP